MSMLDRIRDRRIIERFSPIFDYLAPMMDARVSQDERGKFVDGFRSKSLAVRAAEIGYEPWVHPWLEAEFSKLIFEVMAEDNAGDRTLPALESIPYGIEDELIRRAKLRVPAWERFMRAIYPY